MAEAVGNLRANLTAEWADFRAELQRSSDALGRFGADFGKVAGRVGRGGIALGAAAGAAALAFAGMAVAAATQAQELEGAFRSAFGDSADQAVAWADSLSDSLGRSESQIRTTALGFQNLFGEITPTNEAATEASQRFTQLAIDFAALKAIRTEDAFRLIQQGLAGNARGLRQYGVDLSETAVRQEALRTGVIRSNEELSNEQATLVRASILMRELGDSTGSAAAQAGSAAAEQERLRARLEETRTELGEALIPAITAVQGALADALEGFNNFFEGIGRGLEQNDEFVIRMTQLAQAIRGTPRSYEEVAAALAQVRAEQRAGGEQNTQTQSELRGLSEDTSNYADSLNTLAGTLDSGGPRGRQRTWLEQHRADIERLREIVNPAGEAIRRFAADMEIAQRAGIEMGDAAALLARDLIESAGGVEVFKQSMESLPPAFREAIEQMRLEEAREQLQEYRDELKNFAADLTAEFAPESGVEERVRRINEAFEEGLITIDVYKAAIAEATGANERENKLSEFMREQAEEREQAWGRLRDAIADVATGTEDAADMAKKFVLEWLRAQWIEPFLNRLFSNKGVFGKGGGGFGFDLGGFIGGLFGGRRADGGDVVPGMAYLVGERGRELFVPDQPGSIVPHEQVGRQNVTMNIYTPDANSFRASRRQIAREQRRATGVE